MLLFFLRAIDCKMMQKGERGWNEGRTTKSSRKKKKENGRAFYKNFSQLPKHSLIGGHYVVYLSPTCFFNFLKEQRLLSIRPPWNHHANHSGYGHGSTPEYWLHLPTKSRCKSPFKSFVQWQISRWPSPRSLA